MASSAAAAAAAAVLCVLLVVSISGRPAPAVAGLSLPTPPGPIGQIGGCIQKCSEVAKTCSSLCQLQGPDVPTSERCSSLCGLQAGGQQGTTVPVPVDQAACILCNKTACVPDCIRDKCTCDDSNHATAP
ncbi:hypothetical protein BDA96_08G174700 [Sorghum bicolor]|uniref:Uncharacterized protein n=2 Tax=Sorghum bicolor TaxID=4558 RepID=A0A921QGS0_SORBI|nr:hypothetical protein BDA96_08G174700 [Sorghum bicolor]KXG23913.1 hypothetical protein SORBI_3008G158200 [Sorghum bicolor]